MMEGSISGSTELELHKRLEVWNAFNKLTFSWGNREFEQDRTIFFNVVIEVIVVDTFRLIRLDGKVLNRRSFEEKKKHVIIRICVQFSEIVQGYRMVRFSEIG